MNKKAFSFIKKSLGKRKGICFANSHYTLYYNKKFMILLVLGLLFTSVYALTLDTKKDIRIYGPSGFAMTEGSINTVGDLDGDGFNDLVVGASNNRSVFVYYGGINFDNVSDVNIMDHSDTTYFGYSLTIGDFNSDGFDDLVVLTYADTKKIFVYYGGPSFDGISDLTINTIGDIYQLGCVGDFNSDGFDDLAVGSAYYQNKTYIYYGGPTFNGTLSLTIQDHTNNRYFGWAMACCDINNDGASDLAIASYSDNKAYVYLGGSGFDGISDVNITDHTTVTYFGSTVACGGDLNNDNFVDLVIGSSTYQSSGKKVYVYYGNISFDGTSDVTIADHNDNYFGEVLSNNGDLNGDEIDDLVVAVGANSADAYIYYGSSSFDNISDVTIDETNNNDAVDSTGDLNDDGVSDLVLGIGMNRVNIYYGAVTETNKKIQRVYSKNYNAYPTIVTVQGKLTNSTTNEIVLNGSMRITVLSLSGIQLWQDVFNNSIDSGIFNIPLGAKKELKLKTDTPYKLKIEIDANSLIYSTADVTFGDNSPEEDIIVFTLS